MENKRDFVCPFYNREVWEDECYDMFLIASGLFIDEGLVKEEDRNKLYVMCEKCKKHGLG